MDIEQGIWFRKIFTIKINYLNSKNFIQCLGFNVTFVIYILKYGFCFIFIFIFLNNGWVGVVVVWIELFLCMSMKYNSKSLNWICSMKFVFEKKIKEIGLMYGNKVKGIKWKMHILFCVGWNMRRDYSERFFLSWVIKIYK